MTNSMKPSPGKSIFITDTKCRLIFLLAPFLLTGFTPAKSIDDRFATVPVLINNYGENQTEGSSVFAYIFASDRFSDTQSMIASDSTSMHLSEEGVKNDLRVVLNANSHFKIHFGFTDFGFHYDLFKNENSALTFSLSVYKITTNSYGFALSYQRRFGDDWAYYLSLQNRRGERNFMRKVNPDVYSSAYNSVICREEMDDLMIGILSPAWHYSDNWQFRLSLYQGHSWIQNRSMLVEAYHSSYNHSNSNIFGFTMEFRQNNPRISDELILE